MEVLRLVFSPIEVNTYILSDKNGKCAIIDCGCYNKSEFGKLTDLLNSKNLKPELLLNTHCHVDHVFGNGMLMDKYKLGTFCHESEERNRKNAVMHALLFGLTMESPPEPAGFIADGDNVSFGTVNLLALHVPGHTAGSLAFYSKEDGVVFTGDALFSGSVGRSDLPGGNHEVLINSIRNKLFTLPPETIVYPGHGEATTIGNEVRTNPHFK
jgi:hydroxyacylglutathione hydrolase